MFPLLPQCWPLSFASLSVFFATSFCFFACWILAFCRYLKFLLQYNSVIKRFDKPPLLIIFFFKNPAKKRRHSSATNRAMSLSTYWLDYGRHVVRLCRRCRRRHAYAPTSNTASHDNHEKINSWVSFSFPWCLWGSAGWPFGPPELRYDITLTLLYVSFEISSPCTKMNSRIQLYNATTSSPSRRCEGDSSAKTKMVMYMIASKLNSTFGTTGNATADEITSKVVGRN